MVYRHIKDLREDADLTQQQIADILNCSQVAYSYYETGKRDIPTSILIALAEHYGCSVDYLLDRTEQKESPHIHKDVRRPHPRRR